jgi:hypothetical protein
MEEGDTVTKQRDFDRAHELVKAFRLSEGSAEYITGVIAQELDTRRTATLAPFRTLAMELEHYLPGLAGRIRTIIEEAEA